MLSRRPAPSILLTAVVATVLIVPWAVDGVGGNGHHSEPDLAPAIAEQPLDNLGGGESIREVHQDTPFSMVALTAQDLRGTTTRVRARKNDGSWGPWYKSETLDGVGADAPGLHGTEPVFVGRTNTVQIAVKRPVDAAPTGSSPQPKAAGPALGYRPAGVEQSFAQNVNAVLISPPAAPMDIGPLPIAATAPGTPPHIISRAEWGADESMHCDTPSYSPRIKAAIVHHTAESNDYAPEDSAGIVRSIYAYHAKTLGWCDIAYNALVDKYGQVFEGHAGGMNRAVLGSHTGGFNRDTWGVAMMGNFDTAPPTPIQLMMTARLLGWRLGLDHVDPHGTTALTSAGGSFTHFPAGTTPTLPTIFTHRDVGITDCPGDAAYAEMDHVRDIAARFNQPPGPADLAAQMRGGAISNRWLATGGADGLLGNPTSPESAAEGNARYANFEKGAVYWSPTSGANPVTGAIYAAWGTLGFERGVLGLPTSGEIAEPEWIVQNFQHGTLNFDREKGTVTRVIDGVPLELPPPSEDPVQLERFTPPINP